MASITSTGTRRRRLGLILTAAGALVALAALTLALRPSGTGGAAAGPVRAPASERALVGVGTSTDTSPRSLTPGFRLERGRYTTIEVPGATGETGVVGINNRGEIVGGARGGGQPDRGFLRDARGRFSTFRFPGARSTLAQKINDRGQITGYYSNTADDPREGPTAFLVDRGRYTRIAAPGAVTTTAVGINNRTQVVGQYQDTDGVFHGYVWQRGRFQTIDAPGAVGTSLFDINDRGQIVGARAEPDGTFRGFVLERGRFTTFAAPGAILTVPGDINNRGQIVGFTSTDGATARGFLLARGTNGTFTPISFPGAPSTLAFGLNDAGTITGTYNNPDAPPSSPPDSASPMDALPSPIGTAT